MKTKVLFTAPDMDKAREKLRLQGFKTVVENPMADGISLQDANGMVVTLVHEGSGIICRVLDSADQQTKNDNSRVVTGGVMALAGVAVAGVLALAAGIAAGILATLVLKNRK